jgi:membrane protein DedA with SNARE-associated domain
LEAKDVPAGMTEDDIKDYSGLDWKALGYLTSIVSVFFLGAVAWPKPDDPAWALPVLIAGMAASVLGMGFRYLAHIQQKKEIAKTKAEQRQARST